MILFPAYLIGKIRFCAYSNGSPAFSSKSAQRSSLHTSGFTVQSGLLMIDSASEKKPYLGNMIVKEQIQRKNEDFLILCQTHNVNSLYAFGSATTNRFNEQTSDIDFLVEIDEKDPIERGEKLISLWDKFEQFFQRKVDLLTSSSIKNPVLRNSIDSTKILIYDGARKKIFI
ncbi:MAG: polymerase subunit beta [Sphingobacteriales bacterium]|nr:polymerase subunit beta [Sphingobacteriales bacterium]